MSILNNKLINIVRIHLLCTMKRKKNLFVFINRHRKSIEFGNELIYPFDKIRNQNKLSQTKPVRHQVSKHANNMVRCCLRIKSVLNF